MNAAMAAREATIAGKVYVPGEGLVSATDPAAAAMIAATEAEKAERTYIARAIRALNNRQERDGQVVQQPSASSSYIGDANGRKFVVLKNVNGVLAVYRLKDDGHIEYVAPDYWPDALELVSAYAG